MKSFRKNPRSRQRNTDQMAVSSEQLHDGLNSLSLWERVGVRDEVSARRPLHFCVAQCFSAGIKAKRLSARFSAGQSGHQPDREGGR